MILMVYSQNSVPPKHFSRQCRFVHQYSLVMQNLHSESRNLSWRFPRDICARLFVCFALLFSYLMKVLSSQDPFYVKKSCWSDIKYQIRFSSNFSVKSQLRIKLRPFQKECQHLKSKFTYI